MLSCWQDGHDTKTKKGTCFTCARVGRIVLQVKDLTATGLDTFSELSVLQPSAPYTLHNEIKLATAERPLNVSVNVHISVHGTELDIDDDFELSLSMQGARLLLDILLQIDQGKFWSLTLDELTVLTNYLSTLAAARPEHFKLDFESFGLHINCRSCSSSLLRLMASNLEEPVNIAQLTQTVNSFLTNVGEHFVSDPKVQEHYRLMLAAYSDDALNMELNRSGCLDVMPACKIWASALQCDINPEYMHKHCRLSCGICAQPTEGDSGTATSDGTTLGVVIGAVLFAVCMVGVCLSGACAMCSRKTTMHVGPAVSLTASPTLFPTLSLSDSAEVIELPDQVRRGTSLYRSRAVPVCWRIAVPTCLFFNVCLFLSGHLSIGATVDVDAHIAGDHVRIDRFVEFSLGNSLKDMYNANAMVLFYFVGSFSGLWPYTKLLLLSYCWFAPVGCLGTTRRGSLLAMLDYAGTWSLIDLYVLVMCMLGFHLDIVSPTSLSFVPKDFYVVRAMVTPVWGLYAFMIGVISSLVINYAILYRLGKSDHFVDGDFP